MISRHSSVGEWMRDPRWAEPFQAVMAQAGMTKGHLADLHALSFHQLVVLSQGRMSTPGVEQMLAETDILHRENQERISRTAALIDLVNGVSSTPPRDAAEELRAQ